MADAPFRPAPDSRPDPVPDLPTLLAGALSAPAEAGARIVALHWLAQLVAMRDAWRRTVESPPPEGDALAPPDEATATARDAADILHRARVALRRLRATLKEHPTLRRHGVGRRIERHLKALGRATNDVRDRDVQLEWLDAEAESLAPAARDEAERLRARLAAGLPRLRRRAGRAFRRHLDPVAEEAARRLRHYAIAREVGVDAPPATFAEALADRLEAGGAQVFADVAGVAGLDRQDALHEVRLLLKRQRAMLAPFTGAHPALAVWYDAATRGQDQLGSMRDAVLLADVARAGHGETLAAVLDDVALAHGAAFLADWRSRTDALRALLAAAVAALRAHGGSALPLEIERKYLLRACPPEAAVAPGTRIEQGWLPGTTLRERLRRAIAPTGTVRLTRTVKLGPIEARIEVEEEASPALFDALWPLTAEARVVKRRHVVPDGALRWEIDVFLDRELVLAEVELERADSAPPLPAWLAPYVEREVTGDPAFLNANLARPASPTPDRDA